MSFELLCMGMIALLFGLAVTFFGYRLFLLLLPIWGFFAGFALGAQTIQVVLGDALFGTVTSWVVGFIVGAIFAILSYLFYFIAVAIISGTFGYGVTVALLTAIGLNMGFLVWLIGIVAAIVVIVVVLRFNIQKYAIIVMTAVGGTGIIIFTFLALFGDLSFLDMLGNPVIAAIEDSFWWLIFFLVVAIAGIALQIKANQNWEIETYNRLEAETVS
jgi:hypothetical protein